MSNMSDEGYDMDCEEAPPKKIRIEENHNVAITDDFQVEDQGVNILWPMLYPKPSIDDEMKMEKVLVLNQHESGRGIELPTERLEIIEREAQHRGFLLSGAMSLRRQLIRKITKGSSSFFDTRNMGDSREAQLHAFNFESAVEKYLRNQLAMFGERAIHLVTEADLKAKRLPLTPDFFFPDANVRINGFPVNWIDCKTFYGASSLVGLPYLPIGKLKAQCAKYNQAFGPGAIVFLNGFSQDLILCSDIDPAQVLFLDANPIDTSEIFENFTSMIHKEELHCPPQKVGIIIGKRGRTIQELRESSGCNIEIYQEYHKVVITAATAEQLQKGSEKVQNLLGSLPVQTVQFLCPIHQAGLLIGKRGNVVRELMQQSGCVIKTNRADISPNGQHQIFNISSSSEEGIEIAMTLIHNVINTR